MVLTIVRLKPVAERTSVIVHFFAADRSFGLSNDVSLPIPLEGMYVYLSGSKGSSKVTRRGSSRFSSLIARPASLISMSSEGRSVAAVAVSA